MPSSIGGDDLLVVGLSQYFGLKGCRNTSQRVEGLLLLELYRAEGAKVHWHTLARRVGSTSKATTIRVHMSYLRSALGGTDFIEYSDGHYWLPSKGMNEVTTAIKNIVEIFAHSVKLVRPRLVVAG